MKKRVVITGGAGFVGSNLSEWILNHEDADVIVIDNLFTGNEKNLEGLNLEFVKGDITDINLLNRYITKNSTVYHLATTNIVACAENPEKCIKTNIEGTYNVFETCKNNGVERIVYTSTSSVYGNAKVIPTTENAPNDLSSHYAISKFTGEQLGQLFYRQFKLPLSIVRYSNVYGYHQTPDNPYCGVIGKFFDSAINNQPLTVIGDGTQTRDFTFVEDACEATYLAATHTAAIGEIFNIGTGVETKVIDLAKSIINLTDSQSIITYIEPRVIDGINRRAVNIDLLKNKLEFMPKYNLEEGLIRTFNWQKQNIVV